MREDDPIFVKPKPTLREWCRLIIFEADTPLGKGFDVTLIVFILLSVASVMMASVESLMDRFGSFLIWLEWTFTIAFTIEYLLRVWTVKQPLFYIRSFY
ncbi:ion transporter, partial [Verrucomicrobia bacterium]|nr:ion transporter [Verrucomicrobiota bacterium]